MSLQQGYIYKILLFIDMFCCALVFRDPDVTDTVSTFQEGYTDMTIFINSQPARLLQGLFGQDLGCKL